MKKTLFFAGALIAGSLTAQITQDDRLVIPKGTWTVGGNLSVNTLSNTSENEPFTSENSSTGISFLPNLGYAVGKNTVLGIRPGYRYGESESTFLEDNTINSSRTTEFHALSIASYLRRFFPLNKNLALYLQGELGYEHLRGESTSENNTLSESESTTDTFFIGIRPGITYFVSKAFALEAGIGALQYERSESEFTDSNETVISTEDRNRFNFDLDTSQIFFGLSYYF
ncbi:porin family protein [Muricauda sp. SCSIO 64092]|uniref:outer membrane beta-barrel protein n=1 Tax=Allomuricauda sp. SCSIO 64092 TaxID=2908842 RepID=UPI001FF47A8C|nr:outer membrane beta-barrel protein [Muricauda sp. SCSIO 64092]UOY05915.1 porin family protein [Muricauda sp. SCSIO 64092]